MSLPNLSRITLRYKMGFLCTDNDIYLNNLHDLSKNVQVYICEKLINSSYRSFCIERKNNKSILQKQIHSRSVNYLPKNQSNSGSIQIILFPENIL